MKNAIQPRQLPITLLPTRHLPWLLFSERPMFLIGSFHEVLLWPPAGVLLVQMLVHLQYTVNILTARPIGHGRLLIFSACFGGRALWADCSFFPHTSAVEPCGKACKLLPYPPPGINITLLCDVCLVTTKHNGSQTPTNL